MKINGVTIDAGGSDVTNFTSWTVGTRPDGTSLSEGDFAVDTTHGRGYRWDATVGALLPIDVYGETFDLTAHVNGDEADETELDNFDENNSGTGTVVYGGTSVTLDGGNNSNQAGIIVNQTLADANIDNTKNMYLRTVCARANSTTSVQLAFGLRDGADGLNMRILSNNPWRRVRENSYSHAINTSLTDDAPFTASDTSTHVVEMYIKRDADEDVSYAIVDGKVYHLSAFDQGTISQVTNKVNYIIARGYGSSDSCDLVIYESTFCVW